MKNVLKCYGTKMSKSIMHSGNIFDKYIDNKSIVHKIKTLSKDINEYYDGKSLHIIGLLDGCMPTLNELTRHLTVSFEISTIKISSYKGMKRGDLLVDEKINKMSLSCDSILIVDDIIDSGNTIKKIKKKIIDMNSALDVKVFSLLIKKNVLNICDWHSFVIPNKYVIGYGMDIDNLFRELKDIYIINK